MTWVWLILISAVFLSLRNIFTKKMLEGNDTAVILFFVSLFTTFFLGFFYHQFDFSFPFSFHLLIVIKSLLITLAWILVYEAYKNLDISIVSPLRNLSPIFLVILSFIFLGERITLINFFGILIIIFSAFLLEIQSVSQASFSSSFFRSKYFLYIIIGLFCTSSSAVLDKVIMKEVDLYSLLFLFYAQVSFFLFLFIWRKKRVWGLKKFYSLSHFLPILLIAFFALASDYFYFLVVSIPETLIAIIIPLRRVSTFLSTLFWGKFFHEDAFLYKSLICLLMIVWVYFIVI